MKIVEKVSFAVNTKPFFTFTNKSRCPVIIPLFYAHSITGEFEAQVDIAPITEYNDGDDSFPYSRILYDPYYVENDDGSIADEFEETYPEHNFRPTQIPDLEDINYYKTQEENDYYKTETQDKIDNYKTETHKELIDENTPVTIPPNVKWLSVIIRSGDTVAILASYHITHIIIDDDGNEISLETLLEERDAKLEKKITEKMLEMLQ